MDTLIRRYKRLLTATSTTYIRSLMNTINWDNRLIAIRGARGVGKTTLMLQYLKLHYANDSQSALYTSLDSLYFTQHSLSELAEQFYLKGGKCLFLAVLLGENDAKAVMAANSNVRLRAGRLK